MNTKQLLGTIITAGMLSACGPDKTSDKKDNSSVQDTTRQIKKEIKDTLSQIKKNTVKLQNDVMLFNIKVMKENKDPALTVADGKSLLWMLGSLDADTIIKEYNPQVANTQKPGYNRSRHDIRSIDTLYVPRIFPSMKDFYDTDLQTFLENHPTIKDSVQDDKTIIIVTELPNGHFGLGYYEEGKLQLAYPVSIGDGGRHKDKRNHTWYQGRSPQGRFWIKRKHANKRSYAHDSMAYFLELIGERGLGLHGQKTQSKRQSHGCFRQPQLAAKMLFERVIADTENGTPFISQWAPNKKELDSTMYYNKIHPELKKERLIKRDTIEKSNKDSLTYKTL